MYGKGPQFLTGVVTEDLDTMHNILGGDEWHELLERLMEHVTDFSHKIIPATGRFQL